MSEQIVRDFSPVPPQSLEAERSVLGALLQDPFVVGPSLEVLTAEDFFAPQNQAVYEAIRAVSNRGSAVDLITVDEENDTLTVNNYFGEVVLTVALSDGTEVELLLKYEDSLLAEIILQTL